MEDFASEDNIDIAGEKYEDIDPAIFDDPVLMLKWLDGNPQKERGLPPQPAQEAKVAVENTNTTTSKIRTKKPTPVSEDPWESDHIAAASEIDVAENYASWLDSKMSAASKEELYQAYAIIEDYAYKYKLLTKPILSTSDISTIRNIQNLLVQKKEFRSMDATKRYICGLALRQFVQFLTEYHSSETMSHINTHTLKDKTDRMPQPLETRQPSADIDCERKLRSRRWADAAQAEQNALEQERQIRSQKWAALNK